MAERTNMKLVDFEQFIIESIEQFTSLSTRLYYAKNNLVNKVNEYIMEKFKYV
jgi:hypothetical protein